jgi:hypothetical protein
MVVTVKNGVFWDVTPCGSCNIPEDTILHRKIPFFFKLGMFPSSNPVSKILYPVTLSVIHHFFELHCKESGIIMEPRIWFFVESCHYVAAVDFYWPYSAGIL